MGFKRMGNLRDFFKRLEQVLGNSDPVRWDFKTHFLKLKSFANSQSKWTLLGTLNFFTSPKSAKYSPSRMKHKQIFKESSFQRDKS